jgi:predicted  nucleic acid-binding Zn-ribbon protein
MKEHENVDKIRNFIQSKKEAIKNDIEKKDELLKKIDAFKKDITEVEGKIAELQSKIDGFIFPIKEYLHYHYQYVEGWYQAINSELPWPIKQLDERRSECESIAKAHLNKLNLSEANHQNVVYS